MTVAPRRDQRGDALRSKRKVILVDEHDIALALTEEFSFELDPGERVSIHPLAPVTFWRSEGLEYPLDSVTLAPGVRTGSRTRR